MAVVSEFWGEGNHLVAGVKDENRLKERGVGYACRIETEALR
jgi:hypothetical protein